MARTPKEPKEVKEKSETNGLDFSAIESAITDIKKELGEEVVIETNEVRKMPRVHLDSPILGYIMGDGGCPEGRIIEIYGPESSGKSLLCQFIGGCYQRAGKFVVYVDSEHTFDAFYANIVGLKTTPDCFKLFQPDCGEDAFTIAEKMASTGQIGLVIQDSVAAMTPKAELEGEMTDQQMGAQARMMGKGIRKLTGICSKNGTTMIFVNQIRQKIGVMFGNPETTPGGLALKFGASIRLEVRKAETVANDGDEADANGIKSRVKCIKNKTGIPFRKGEMYFDFKNGVDFYGEYIDFAVKLEVVSKGGAWYSYNEERWQGAKNFAADLRTRPELFKEIKDKVDAILQADPTKKIELTETEEVKPKKKEKEVEQTLSLAAEALSEGE